jgi:hypothetical protein
MGLPKTYKSASIFSRGSAYDVQKPTTDHDPTANLLNYDDIDATTEKAGGIIGGLIGGAVSLAQNILDTILGISAEPIAELQTWVTNILSIPANIIAGFTGGSSSGGPFSGVFDTIRGLLGVGNNAQTSAGRALAEIELLKADGGGGLSDPFEGAQAVTLGTNWHQRYKDGTDGYLGRDGSGNASWTPIGGGVMTSLNRFDTAMTSNRQKVGIVLGDVIANTTNPPQAGGLGRMNVAQDSYSVSVLGNGFVELGYVISDVYTRLGATATGVSMAPDDTWDTIFGDGDDNVYTLLRNNIPIITRNAADGVSSALRGSSYLNAGFFEHAGNNFFGFGFIQVAPPVVRAWTGYNL